MAVQILSRKMVKPAFPTPDHLRTCKLSFFDQLAPPAHAPLVFFYHNSNGREDKIREQLVITLSQALTKFYPLAGRFVQDGFYVDCNDKGVDYIEAEVDIELAEFLSIAPKNVHMVNELVPWDIIGDSVSVTTPIMGIKVSIFKSGGLAISMLLSHIIADGFTAAKFIHEWAIATSDYLLGNSTISDHEMAISSTFGGIGSHFPARDLSDAIKPVQIPSSKRKEGKIVTRRFVFDENAISALKAKVSKWSNINRPTRVEVVTSTIWKALISINGDATQSKRRQSTLYLHLNLRGRTGIVTLDDNYSLCGNFYMEVPTKFNDDKMEGMGLHELVNLLRNSLRNSRTNCSKILSADGLVMEVAKHVNEIREEKGNEEVDVHLLSTLCRFPLYEVDFGLGKPEWVTTGGMPVELVFLLDTKCGTGIEALVNLDEKDMLQFETDPDIVAFTS